ncbi:MAG: SpoIIE family protein phosphatase [Planctomycetaceae bacterium]|nr:SpoIIE family protein phosphatase [Planctomycetaceae bacterium]
MSAIEPAPKPIQSTRGELQAVRSEIDKIEVRNTVTDKRIAVLDTHTKQEERPSPITSLLLLPETDLLICGKSDGRVQVWNLEARRAILELNSFYSPIISIGVDTKSNTLLAVADNGSMDAWDLETGVPQPLQQVSSELPISYRFYHDIDFGTESVVQRMFWYTIIEWTAVCIALITGFLAIIHYLTVGDVSTPIVGTALFFSGLIDAFNVLSADHLVNSVEDTLRFIPITWAISRTFNITILIIGTSLILLKRRTMKNISSRGEFRFLAVVAFLFAFISYGIVHICSVLPALPQAIYPEAFLAKRPWDILPLVLLLFAGTLVFPRFYRRYPSLFSHGIFLSVIPQLATQLHAVFWTTEVFDGHFFAAHCLRVLAYLVPLVGLILDYNRVHGQEATFHETQQKLLIARSVQQNLLPETAPVLVGIDLAGKSQSSDAVGGDYFDYLELDRNRLGIVIADVSGHDFGASLFMAQTRAYLRALANTHEDLAEVLQRLNDHLTTDSNTHRFVTLFLARFDPETDILEYIAAGHQSLVLTSKQSVQIIGPTGPPLGVMQDEHDCKVEQISFPPGSILVELTDGILEVTNSEGKMFGNEGVISLLKTNDDKCCQELVDLLISSALDYSGQPVPKDDMTVVVLKHLDQ